MHKQASRGPKCRKKDACGATFVEQGITGHCMLQLQGAASVACEIDRIPSNSVQPARLMNGDDVMRARRRPVCIKTNPSKPPRRLQNHVSRTPPWHTQFAADDRGGVCGGRIVVQVFPLSESRFPVSGDLTSGKELWAAVLEEKETSKELTSMIR
jgi:hypothetical protein